MRTDFSEFSFGYALVEELANGFRPTLTAVPVFPSLIEEGHEGGGYDVKFELPGAPLLIQFKRPDVMLTAKAKEISIHGLGLGTPFYRFHIRSSAVSKQHDLLLGHDTGTNLVYYASPCFHEISTFNGHYVAQQIISNTIFIRPRDIGRLSAEPHHVAYDGTGHGWRFSDEPVRVLKLRIGREIEGDLRERLRGDDRPLGEGPIKEVVASIERTLRRLRISLTDSNPRLSRLSGSKRDLARLAELAHVYLGAQTFIVQHVSDGEPS